MKPNESMSPYIVYAEATVNIQYTVMAKSEKEAMDLVESGKDCKNYTYTIDWNTQTIHGVKKFYDVTPCI